MNVYGNNQGPPETFWKSKRSFLKPLLSLLFFLTIIFIFRDILLIFILAALIAFIIEPVIRRILRLQIKGRFIPRWLAVVMVYLTFFSVVGTFGAIVIPKLSGEMIKLADEVPDFYKALREDYIPRLNTTILNFLSSYSAEYTPDLPVDEAREQLYSSVGAATTEALKARTFLVTSPEPPDEAPLLLLDRKRPVLAVTEQSVDLKEKGDDLYPVLFKIVAAPSGGFDVKAVEFNLELTPSGENRYVLKPAERGDLFKEAPIHGFDLGEKLNILLERAVAKSSEGIAAFLQFGQKLLFGLLGAFVSIILTFMISAFISIDAQKFQAFFKGLFPLYSQDMYDEFLVRLDRGLSGVVRGQLIICLVNGLLTWIGLLVFEVKFALILATIAATLSLIPIFGTILSTVPCVIIGLTNGLTTGVGILAWILGIHFIESNFLNPKIIGSSAELHPVVVFFALLAGEHSYGMFGVLLAVPTASILRTIFNFLSDAPWKQGSAEQPVNVESEV